MIQKSNHPVRLIHHAANVNHHAPAGSLAALKECLVSGAAKVEMDVIPLADGSFALLHDPDLKNSTEGQGNAITLGRTQVENLHYVRDGEITHEKVGFLEGAVDLLAQFPTTQCLQLDLKPFTPLTGEGLDAFLNLITPVIDRIQVSSFADWAVRALSKAAPTLSLGFDPLLYLDIVDDQPRPENIPPFRVGAYGLRDDHPLSAYQWGAPGDYFAARAAALLEQVPQGCEWFIRAEVLKMAWDASFDWIGFLHQQGAAVDGWTIDVSKADQMQMAKMLVDLGIDELTTDAPGQLANLIGSDTII